MKTRLRSLWSLIGAIALTGGLITPRAHAAIPGLSGTLSVVPGLGQAINGNPWEGLGWLASIGALYTSGNTTYSQIGFDLWMYNMYDAYRDAGAPGAARHSLLENSLAAYNPLNLIDPIGASVVAYGALGGRPGGYPALRSPQSIITYGFVGLGEEGLFRGFLFPSLSQLFGSKVAGALVSSAAFSVSHATGGKSNLEASALTQRFIGGLVFCWQADRNRYDLRKNIFAHAWYDVLVDEGGQIRGLQLKLPLP